MKTYLRIVEARGFGTERISLFEGNPKTDKEYWRTYHELNARYFELKEIKVK